MASQMETPSRLLTLPPELRNRIFEFCFDGRSELLRAQNVSAEDINKHGFETKPPGLLRCCKQIHQEAVQMYYFSTNFVTSIDDDHIMHDWLLQLKPTYANLIRKIRVFRSLESWQSPDPHSTQEGDLGDKTVRAATEYKYNKDIVRSAAPGAELEFNIWIKKNLREIFEAHPTLVEGKKAYSTGGKDKDFDMNWTQRPSADMRDLMYEVSCLHLEMRLAGKNYR